MTSSNAPAAGGRIDSDDRAGPERGPSPPPLHTAPPPPPRPQASLPPASAPPQLLRAPSPDPAPTSIALAQATNATLDAPPTQPSGSPNANLAASFAPRTTSALEKSATPADGQNRSADSSKNHGSPIQPSAADPQMSEPVDNTASQPPRLPLLDTTMYALNLASNADADDDYYDQPMLSPPTVSPLSTPAVTHVNIDDDKDMDVFMLAGPANTTDLGTGRKRLQEAASIVSNAAGGFAHSQSLDNRADPTAMDLDEPQLPETSQYHAQLIRQHGLGTAGNRRSGLSGMPRSLEHMQSIATTDPEPDSTQRYESGRANAIGNVDPNVLMMALANASGAQFDHLPNAVAPSEISLHDHTSLTQEDIDPTTSSASARTSQNLESFARIEFEDSVFQMTTYAVIIGRDQKAINQARKDERRMEGYRRRVDDAMRHGLPPPTPIAFDRGKFSKSYVSEEGGMLGPESDGEDNAKGNKRRRVGSIHASVNGEEGNDADAADRVKSNRQYVSHTPGAAAVDVGTLQPSTAHIPFIGIHSPGPDIAKKTKGISRQHLKIQFNEALGVFQAIALHRNGFFVGDVICKDEHPVTVRSGEKLQIKDVSFRFIINGVEEGKTGGEELDEETSSKRMSIGGKEMSFDFEHSENDKYQDSSEDLSPLAEAARSPSPASSSVASPVAPRLPPPPPAPAPLSVPIAQVPIPEPAPRMPSPATLRMPDPMHHGLSMEELALSQLQEAVSRASPSDPEPLPPPPPPLPMPQIPDPVEQPMVPMEDMRMIDASTLGLGDEFPPEFLMQIPKRRGPGRPPKDGIMSKRERRLLKKQLQENSRKTLPQEPQGEKIKRPVGRPRKNPLPEDGDRIEKRKYNKRKSIEDGDIGSDAERRAREKKDKKVRPKSPPLQLNREDFTEEQLAKPSKNYGVLIDEALNHGPPEGLTLKQIYKRITQRYPWFYFHAETKGWESSVRHNLIGNEAFKKAETTGLWSRVPGVELDAGKKRKAVSPDRHMGGPHGHLAHMAQHQYYQGGPYMAQPMAYGHGMPNTYAGNAQAQGSGQPLQTALPVTPAQQQNLGQPGYPSQTPAPAQLPPGYGASTVNNRPPATGPQNTYSSPYARPPPPPPAQGAAVKNESNAPTASQNMPSTLQQGIPPAAPLKPLQQTPTVTVQQPQNQPPRSTQPVPATSTSTNRPYLTPEMEKAIAQFRTNVMADLSKHTKNAGQIIDAAIGRVRGLSTPATVPGFEEVERTLVNGLQMMISKMQKVEIRGATPTSAPPAPAHLQAQKQPPLSQPFRPPQPLSQVTPSTHTASPAVTASVAQQVLQPAQTTPTSVATRQTPVQHSQPSQTMPQSLQQNPGQAQGPKPMQLPQVQPAQAQPPAQQIAAAHLHAQTPAVPQVQASAPAQTPSRPQPPAQNQSMPQQRTQIPQQSRAQPAQQPTPVKATPIPTQISTPGVGHASAAVSACDAEIQRRIKSFRESIIGTLKAKTNQAEAIVDSAIRRAQRLSNPGAFKGWEQADRLMYESVTKIINDVRKRQDLAAQAASGTASARSSQTPAPAASLQKAPSASPAPGTPGMPSPAAHSNNQPRLSHTQGQPTAASPSTSSATTPSMKAATPYVPRPGISVARPVSTQVQRPSPSNAASPPVVRKESVSVASGAPVPSFVAGSQMPKNPGPAVATAAGSAQPPPARKSAMPATQVATPAIKQSFAQSASGTNPAVKATLAKHNFTGAANPSAGVVDQIAAHKPRPNNPGATSAAVPQQRLPANPSSVPHAPSPTTGKLPNTTPNFSGAARPSAGVVSQITGHQQRNAPDSAMAKFPSPAPPSAGVLDQITSQHQKLANQQAAKPASSASPFTRPPASGIAPSVGQSDSPQPVMSKPIAGPQNVASPATTNAATAQPLSPPVTAQRLEAAQPAGPHAASPQVAPPHPAPSQSPASRPPGSQPLVPRAPAVNTPPSQGPATKPQAAQISAAQVPAARPPVAQGLAAPSSSNQNPASSVQAAQGPPIKSELSQSPATQGPVPQGLKAQTAQRSPSSQLSAVKPSVGQPGTQMAISRAGVPLPTLTPISAVKPADGSSTSQPPGVQQLAGQKRPLEPEANKNNGEEPQLKKVAISAE